MASKQISQCSIDIKDPDGPEFESIAYVRLIHRDLAAEHEAGIRGILGDWSDFKLRLHLTRDPHINVIHSMLSDQVAPLRHLGAEHPGWCGLRTSQIHRRP